MTEDEQLEKITIARDYTSLEGALQEMLDILSGKYDKYEEEEIPMTKHVWKTHKTKDKAKKKNKDNAFDNVLVNIFNIGNGYFKGYTSQTETAKAIYQEISNATR